MRIKEIEECCHAIDHLRCLINGCSQSDSNRISLISELFVTYQDLHSYMQEEIEFLESVSIK